jgi:hypothetical protein
MNPYEELCAVLAKSGVKFGCGKFEPGINWYDFSPAVLKKAKYEIAMLDGVLVFDANGKHIAGGHGDEQPGKYELL